MSDSEGFRTDLKGTLKQAYTKADPILPGSDVRAIRRAEKVLAVERRGAQVREKARTHYAKNKDIFITREFARQMQANPLTLKHDLSSGPRPPQTLRKEAHRQAMMMRAERQVHMRQQARLHNIDRAERRIVRQILRGRDRTR